MQKCPGQDNRFWKADDVRLVPCPQCGTQVEFFKDDRSRACPECHARFKNPHLDLACAEWCPFASACLDFEFGEPEAPKQEPGK